MHKMLAVLYLYSWLPLSRSRRVISVIILQSKILFKCVVWESTQCLCVRSKWSSAPRWWVCRWPVRSHRTICFWPLMTLKHLDWRRAKSGRDSQLAKISVHCGITWQWSIALLRITVLVATVVH